MAWGKSVMERLRTSSSSDLVPAVNAGTAVGPISTSCFAAASRVAYRLSPSCLTRAAAFACSGVPSSPGFGSARATPAIRNNIRMARMFKVTVGLFLPRLVLPLLQSLFPGLAVWKRPQMELNEFLIAGSESNVEHACLSVVRGFLPISGDQGGERTITHR